MQATPPSFQSPTQCAERVQAMRAQFRAGLDDYLKYYVYYYKSPESDEFQRLYAQARGQLHQLSRDALQATQDAQTQTQALAQADRQTQARLRWEQSRGGRLGARQDRWAQTHARSDQMLRDLRDQYRGQYAYNVALLVGMGGLAYAGTMAA
jgi:flagellar motility protein MotE (MotC chaperone)